MSADIQLIRLLQEQLAFYGRFSMLTRQIVHVIQTRDITIIMQDLKLTRMLSIPIGGSGDAVSLPL